MRAMPTITPLLLLLLSLSFVKNTVVTAETADATTPAKGMVTVSTAPTAKTIQVPTQAPTQASAQAPTTTAVHSSSAGTGAAAAGPGAAAAGPGAAGSGAAAAGPGATAGPDPGAAAGPGAGTAGSGAAAGGAGAAGSGAGAAGSGAAAGGAGATTPAAPAVNSSVSKPVATVPTQPNTSTVTKDKASGQRNVSSTRSTANAGPTSISKDSTGGLPSDQQTTAHSTITLTGGHINTGTTSSPSTQNKAGPAQTHTSVPKVGAPSEQSTSNRTPTTSSASSTTSSTAAQPRTFVFSLNSKHEKEEEKALVEVCKRLMTNMKDGNCTLIWRDHKDKVQFDRVEINGKVKTELAKQHYEDITRKPTANNTLIAILASCGALLIMIVILAVCASQHRKPYSENQQHLTEELHTVENGYHDNPTLEVMEVQPEMQEKKMALNGEFNDSWIVPIDNLLKEDIPDEEDTHL